MLQETRSSRLECDGGSIFIDNESVWCTNEDAEQEGALTYSVCYLMTRTKAPKG